MKLFLDSSVVLAACGRPSGASRAVFDLSRESGWTLLASGYVFSEVRANLPRFAPSAAEVWGDLAALLVRVEDKLVFDWPVVFSPAKDRPILFSALAFADVLLTFDSHDFGTLMDTRFYGLQIMKPGTFLERERAAGRI